MARPREKDPERLNAVLPPTRCTEADRKRIQARAAQAGLSLSAYLRRMALRGQITVHQASTDFETVDQLRRIGVLINQQTRKLHQSGEVPEELHRLWAKLETALDRMLDDHANSR